MYKILYIIPISPNTDAWLTTKNLLEKHSLFLVCYYHQMFIMEIKVTQSSNTRQKCLKNFTATFSLFNALLMLISWP